MGKMPMKKMDKEDVKDMKAGKYNAKEERKENVKKKGK